MTNELGLWLKAATRGLSAEPVAQVEREIQDHFESARAAALEDGATEERADQRALAALGDPRVSNRAYRRVMLTAGEARLLRAGQWEARAVCGMKRMWLAVPGLVLMAAAAARWTGSNDVARVLLLASVGLALVMFAPFLPIYTASRSRVARVVKWVVLAGLPGAVFGADALKYSWLLFASLWPVFWVEWQRAAIRRKLPVGRWPKHLYL